MKLPHPAGKFQAAFQASWRPWISCCKAGQMWTISGLMQSANLVWMVLAWRYCTTLKKIIYIIKNGDDVWRWLELLRDPCQLVISTVCRKQRTLVKRDGSSDSLRNNTKCTALMLAADLGHRSILQRLLFARADVTLHAGDSTTALTSATQKGHFDVVEELLHVGQDGIWWHVAQGLTDLSVEPGHNIPLKPSGVKLLKIHIINS